MNWETIAFFGDSLTFGARCYMGYPEYCADKLEKELGNSWNVVNHATNGFRAIDLVRSVNESYNTINQQSLLISFILIGTNDAKTGTSIKDYKIALNQLIIKSKLLTVNGNLVLIKIPLLQKGVSFPYKMEMNNSIENYNTVISELAEKYKIDTVKLDLDQDDFVDGVHFNQKGTDKISEQISNYILNLRK